MRQLLLLALLLNAAQASASRFGRLPVAPARPASLPVMRLPLLPQVSLPGVSVPAANGGVSLPGKPSPLPLQLPAELAAPAPAVDGVVLRPAGLAADAPAALEPGDGYFMRWDLLDGEDDGLSPVFVPVTPGPKPLSPAGAMAEVERADETPFEVFDGSRLVPALVR